MAELTTIDGIGKSTAEKLNALGIMNTQDLALSDASEDIKQEWIDQAIAIQAEIDEPKLFESGVTSGALKGQIIKWRVGDPAAMLFNWGSQFLPYDIEVIERADNTNLFNIKYNGQVSAAEKADGYDEFKQWANSKKTTQVIASRTFGGAILGAVNNIKNTVVPPAPCTTCGKGK